MMDNLKFFQLLKAKFSKIFSKNIYIFIIFFILLFLVYYWQFDLDFWRYDPPRKTILDRCSEDIANGLLYKFNDGGYIDCIQSPIYLYLFFFIMVLAGWSMNLALSLTGLLSIIISSFSLLLMYKIAQKEVKDNKLSMLVVLFIFYVLFVVVQVLGLREHVYSFDIKVSLLLLLFGFYVLNYTELKYKEYLVSLIFWLAIFFKFINATFVFFILICYIKSVYKSSGKKETFKSLYKLALPFILLTLTLFLIYPILLKILIGMNYSTSIVPFYALTKFFLDASWQTYFFICFIIISLYLFLRFKDVFSFISFSGALVILLYSLLIVGRLGGPDDYRYLQPIFPFFIIVLTKFFYNIKKSLIGLLFVSFVLILISYPMLNNLFLTHYITKLDHQLSYPLSFVPKQEGRILTDYNRFEWYGNKIADRDKIDEVRFIGNYDEAVKLYIERVKLANFSEWIPKDKERLDIYKNKLFNKEYSLISVSSVHELSSVNDIIESNDTLIPYKLDYSPAFFIPSLERLERHAIALFFSDSEDYNKIRKQVLDYYDNNFNSICKKSRFVASEVLHVLNSNPNGYGNFLPFDKYCNSNFDSFARYANSLIGKNKPKINDLIIILSLFGIISLFIFRKNFNFYVLSTLILILLIIIAIVYLRNEPTCGINDVSWISQLNIKLPDGKEVCCQDYNKNKNCDYFELFETKECFTILNNGFKVPLGINCSIENDCIPKLNKINEFYPTLVKEKLNESKLSCESSYYAFKDFLGNCKEAKDCKFDYKNEAERELLKDSFKCKFDICTVLKGTLQYQI